MRLQMPLQGAHPKARGIDDQYLSDSVLLVQMAATSNPKGQDAASGHLSEQSESRQEYLQGHVQLWEEKPRLGPLPKKMSDSASPDGEKKD